MREVIENNTKPVPKQQQLTVIAIHKKKGEESLNKFKEEVRKFAVDHTFKETAKRFGIHHSTVSPAFNRIYTNLKTFEEIQKNLKVPS